MVDISIHSGQKLFPTHTHTQNLPSLSLPASGLTCLKRSLGLSGPLTSGMNDNPTPGPSPWPLSQSHTGPSPWPSPWPLTQSSPKLSDSLLVPSPSPPASHPLPGTGRPTAGPAQAPNPSLPFSSNANPASHFYHNLHLHPSLPRCTKARGQPPFHSPPPSSAKAGGWIFLQEMWTHNPLGQSGCHCREHPHR